MTIHQYIDSINKRYKQGNATEHTFRGDLQQLIESLVPEIRATNEPKRQTCGAPDYILTRKDIPVGFIEAKDIGDKDLDGTKKTGNKEQFDRYRASLNNLIFTDYLNFHLYRDGQFITKIAIAELSNNSIVPLPDNFATFSNLIKDFTTHIGQIIKSSKKLAEMMAGKARLLSDVIDRALTSDEAKEENSTLKEQMNAFREILIHDITAKGFADVYAQTIAYGMFAARLHDPTLPTFSRQEAAELIPKSNPFLRKLFGYIAGPDIDDRIKWIVDSLVEIFLACNVEEILKNYGSGTKTEDPIIHFYETFLSEYDPKLRKARGVWYTPHPVVNFIVRAVDDILKSEFNLPDGLADNSKTKIKVKLQETDKRYKDNIKTVEEEVHRVQILDPATGTGTFLAEVVKQIHNKFEGQQGIWSNYVDVHLLPRLNGFELLMASYAMAHLQLDLLLKETGYKSTRDQRFRVYLTNSLEEHHPDTGTLFANWLSSEANEANKIKRDSPVMVVMGNPPYSGESANKGKWIKQLIDVYKYEPGGISRLKEKNSKWINADENKFIRYGQHFIEKNGSGILAYITPHTYLDNPTLRGMRWNLLKTFDSIYILDLHGNSKRQERSPDGSIDVNVFDIMQGVSINIFIKTGRKRNEDLANVFHHDLFGKRENKYSYLLCNSLKVIGFKKIAPVSPNYYFIPKNISWDDKYFEGFSVKEIFITSVLGFQTHRDHFAVDFENVNTKMKISEMRSDIQSNEIYKKYNLNDNRDWKLNEQRAALKKDTSWENYFVKCLYRPFDYRSCYLSYVTMDYPRKEIINNILNKQNYSLLISRQQAISGFQHIFVSDLPPESCVVSSKTKEQNVVFPIYSYSDSDIFQQTERKPNLNRNIINIIENILTLKFTPETTSASNTFIPIDILDYIYAILHSPSYREKYKEFLKIDFPRVPYPKDQTTFWQLVKLGKEIRQIHLLESPDVNKFITTYPVDGDNTVSKLVFKQNKIFINDTQYFDNVPEVAWIFYIGGYQPAQKWLKDRKGRVLSFEDIMHYQKILVALNETDKLMKEIDKIECEWIK